MSFFLAQGWATVVYSWVMALVFPLAPVLYLALAWPSVKRRSVRGVWGTALGMMGAMALLVLVTVSLAETSASLVAEALVMVAVRLGTVLLASATVLAFALRGEGPRHWTWWLVGAAVAGYLAMPVGVVAALFLSMAMASFAG